MFAGAVPSLFSDPAFTSGGFNFHELNGGRFDIDVGANDADPLTAPTDIELIDVDSDPNLGFDLSDADDAYQDWTWDDGGAFETDNFDAWSYGDTWEPVVLDLDGDGIAITPRDASSVTFDTDFDGFFERTAWAGPGDGLLVIDLAASITFDANGNLTAASYGPDGQIASPYEIAFWTTDPAIDTDLKALKALFDSNGNAQLDAGDLHWGDFRVWKDANQDGTSDAGEVVTLASLGITSIGLVSDNQSMLLPDGTLIHGYSSMTRTVGGVTTTAAVADAGFAYDIDGYYAVEEPGFGFTYYGEDGTVLPIGDAHALGTYAKPTAYNVDSATVAGLLAGAFDDDIFVTGNGPVTLYGDGGNDVITGGGGNDEIDGGSGLDTINAGGGDDTIYFDAPEQALISGGAGYDTGVLTSTAAITIDLGARGLEGFIASSGNDAITASAAVAATIDARGGNDTVTGSTLGDVLDGGAGNDVINAGAGGDLVLGGAGTDTLNGEAGNDNLIGGEGNDTLDGGSGADALKGGLGNDSYYVDQAGDTVVEQAGSGTDIVNSSVFNASIAGFANVENVQLLGALALSATGNSSANILFGSTNTGANVLTGLGGNDTFYVGAGDTIVEIAGGGTDTVYSSLISLNLASFANVENATLLGALALSATGNAGANGLTGSSSTGANVLTGLAGNDVYTVGTGDTIVEAAGGGTDVVISSLISLSLASYANVENVWLNGALALGATGDAGANALDGAANSAANVLTGLGGSDTYFVGAGDTIVEAAGGGTDTANSATVSIDLGIAAFANVENAQLNGSAALNATGDANANTLTGSTSTGANVLTGLGGNDTFHVGAGDTIVEIAGGGTDTVYSSLISLNLASFAQVENATLTGVLALSATGNANANGLTGSSSTAANVLTGLAGNDVYTVGAGDTIVEAAVGGTDVVISSLISLNLASYANVENVWLNGALALGATGNGVANNVTGNSAANTLTGLGGADTFFFNTALGASNIDSVTDFSVADDTIGLENAIFTTLAVGTLAGSAFVTGAAALDADDRIIYNSVTGALIYDSNGNAAGGAQQFASLGAGLALTSADFTVI